MTRINVGVKPAELNDKMLLAEHREIKRIPNCIRKGRYNLDGQPKNFKLGAGHVKFFYDKLDFLYKRYMSIYYECINRGFNVQNYRRSFTDVSHISALWNDYIPSDLDRQLILQRINSKLNKL